LANNTIVVPVNFNFVNNAVMWQMPNKVTVNHGDVDTIEWNLTNGALPPGAASVKFAQNNPIQFVTSKNGVTGDNWTGPLPTRVSDSQVTVVDDNTTQTGTKHYYYSVNVATYDSNGGLLNSYAKDPEVESEGPPPSNAIS
jgi:hypothetical protein